MIRLKVDFSMRNLGVPINIWNKNKNQYEELDALFDTGAHTSAIDTTILLNLGYNTDGAAKSFIATATSPRETAKRIRIDKMMLGDTQFCDVFFNTFEFPLRNRPIIIGMNIIRQFEIGMNFKDRLITMSENYLDDSDNYCDSDIFGDWRVDGID
jgi:hypothetical protein